MVLNYSLIRLFKTCVPNYDCDVLLIAELNQNNACSTKLASNKVDLFFYSSKHRLF
jgi:hypothetical protein